MMRYFQFNKKKISKNTPEYTVRVDQLTCGFISGWIMRSDTKQQVSFDLLINGVVVGAGLTADTYRSDLAVHFDNHGQFGYCIRFDLESGDGPLLIEFKEAHSGLLIAQMTQKAEKYAGHIDGYVEKHLVGWCYDPTASTPMLIDVCLDGKPVQRRFPADLPRDDVVLPDTTRRSGFSVPLANLGRLDDASEIEIINHRTGEPICKRPARDLFEESYFALEQDTQQAPPAPQDSIEKDRRAIQDILDTHFYRQKYNLQADLDPVTHYLNEGWKTGCDPVPWFSTSFYLQNNADVLEHNVNPFVHYLKNGHLEGRLPAQEPGITSLLAAPWSDQSQHLLLTSCVRRGNELMVEGYVRHPHYPGLPWRLEIGLEGQDPVQVLARGNRPYPFGKPPFDLEGHLPFKCTLNVDSAATELKLCASITDMDMSYDIKLQPGMDVTEDNIIYPDPKSNWPVIGSVDGVSENRITGWALYMPSPETPVTLVLSIAGVPIASVICRIHRKDLFLNFGGSGYAGFVFDLPPEAASQLEYTDFTIAPAVGINKINRNRGSIPHKGMIAFDPPQKAARPALPAPVPAADVPVSAIVLNLNGAEVLEDLLQTAFDHEENQKIDWVIVDHGSQDTSEAIAQQAIARGQQVRFIRRDGNLSFSDSNNYGARLAKHDVLMFINNDLIFRAPFRQKVLDTLAMPDVGAVGALLYDYLPPETDKFQAPIQHTGVCFSQRIEGRWIRPFELRPIPGQMDEIGAVLDAPVVTGAFIAMRRADFDAIGGFAEEYVYGLEDVDLCLKVRADLKKQVVCDTRLDIVHHRGFSRQGETNVTIRQRNNNDVFNRTWALALRKSIRNQVATKPAYWSGSTPVVAFIVADAGDNTSAGEYFTALELGRELQKNFPCQLRFLTEPDWMNLEETDVVITMVSHFDILKAKRVNPYLIAINWTRQWFDRWAENDGLFAYDVVYASSQRAADFLAEKTGLEITVLPIATDFEKFAAAEPDEDLRADYCFTGNYVGTNREIMYQLRPDEINASGAVYGAGWKGMPFEDIWRGPIAYSKMPQVYASTKIVIDDANIATKGWGSCNSRVFDAIAGGCLLITNGPKGVQELFGDAVPTFDSAQSLKDTIEYWLEHEDERQERVRHLQDIVRANHTYAHRGKAVGDLLSAGNLKPKIAIKCPAIWEERESWGDYHFAHALAKELRQIGFTVRVDCRENWYTGMAATDDVNLVLRGIKPFEPPAHQLNILWMISHPADIPMSEVNRYDHVYTASHIHKELLKEIADVPVETLLQCTDGERFNYNAVDVGDRNSEKALFVGNSRGVFRHAVRWAVETEKDIDLYGKGWEHFVKDQRLKGAFISNARLPEYYGKSKVVLCDHWSDMARYGYLSNRAFDVLACGSWLAVDEVAGLQDILPGGYTMFKSKEELRELLETPRHGTEASRKKLAKWVADNHTFRNRAEVLGKRIKALLPPEMDATSFLSRTRKNA